MDNEYIFESERLGFRRWKDSDKIPFSTMNTDLCTMKYFPNVLTKEESDLLITRFEKHFNEKGFGIWAVERKDDNEFIGFIGMLEVNMDIDFKGSIEIGWRLDKRFWKKGYAVEGAKACLDYGFKTLKMKEICSFTAVLNQPSETLMKRIGMTRNRVFDHPNLEVDSPLRKHVLYKMKNNFFN